MPIHCSGDSWLLQTGQRRFQVCPATGTELQSARPARILRYIDRHRVHARSRITRKSAAAAGKPGDEHPYAIFRNRDFTLYLTGRLVAVLGQQMFAMAMGWELYERTGSALALGLVGLTLMIPMFLFTLPAGHVADNYNRKRIVVSMATVMAAASLGVAVVSLLQAPVVLDLRLPVHRRHGPHVHRGRPTPPFCRPWWTARISRAR